MSETQQFSVQAFLASGEWHVPSAHQVTPTFVQPSSCRSEKQGARQHLGQLLGIAQLSEDKVQYEKNVRKIFGDQQELDV